MLGKLNLAFVYRSTDVKIIIDCALCVVAYKLTINVGLRRAALHAIIAKGAIHKLR